MWRIGNGLAIPLSNLPMMNHMLAGSRWCLPLLTPKADLNPEEHL